MTAPTPDHQGLPRFAEYRDAHRAIDAHEARRQADLQAPSALEQLLAAVEAEASTPVIDVQHDGTYPFAGCTFVNDSESESTRVYLGHANQVDVTDAFNAWAAEHSHPRSPQLLALVAAVRADLAGGRL